MVWFKSAWHGPGPDFDKRKCAAVNNERRECKKRASIFEITFLKLRLRETKKTGVFNVRGAWIKNSLRRRVAENPYSNVVRCRQNYGVADAEGGADDSMLLPPGCHGRDKHRWEGNNRHRSSHHDFPQQQSPGNRVANGSALHKVGEDGVPDQSFGMRQ